MVTRSCRLYVVWPLHTLIQPPFCNSSILRGRYENSYHFFFFFWEKLENCSWIAHLYYMIINPIIFWRSTLLQPSSSFLIPKMQRHCGMITTVFKAFHSILLLQSLTPDTRKWKLRVKNKYRSLLPVFRYKTNKTFFKHILFLTTRLKRKNKTNILSSSR